MMHIITYKHLNEPLGLALTIKKSIDFLHKSPYYSNLRHRNQALFSQINIFFLFNKNIKEKQNLTRESQATQKSQPKDVFARRHEEHKEEKIRKCSHKKAQKPQKLSTTVADLRHIGSPGMRDPRSHEKLTSVKCFGKTLSVK
jgi:hypothetical protein